MSLKIQKLPWDAKEKFPVTGEFLRWAHCQRTGGLGEQFLKVGECEDLSGENID